MADTLSEAASAELARAIIKGDLRPGSRLAVRDLAKQFGYGPTPLREALSGLAARGFVTFTGQRGFRVAEASRDDLLDIVSARTLVEAGALRLAIRFGDTDWEAGVVAALHRMKAFYNKPDGGIHDVDEFERVNRDFHIALIAGCGSPRVLAIYRGLFEQTRRYRMMLLQANIFSVSSFDVHQEMAESCLVRDADTACRLIEAHNAMVLSVYE